MNIRQKTPYVGGTPDMAFVTGNNVSGQWLQYGGKAYHVDDILAVMKAAESETPVLSSYIVVTAADGVFVAERSDSTQYKIICQAGDEEVALLICNKLNSEA